MSTTKRVICILLSLALLLTWPGFAQQADAVAGVDDAALAVGLLFCTWAGVTFATNQGAYNAVSNFLNSSVNGLKACTEVVAKNLVNGTLTLTKGVRDAFNSILPEINSRFRTPVGSTEGSLVGSVPAGVPIGIPSFADTPSASDLNYCSADLFAKGAYPISVSTSYGDYQIAPYFKESYEAQFGISLVDPSGDSRSVSRMSFMYDTKFIDFTSYFVGNELYFAAHHIAYGKINLATVCAYIFTNVKSSSMSFPASEDAIPFNRNQTINGTQAQNALGTADLPDSPYGDSRDHSIDIAALLAAIAAGLAGSAAAPGLSPDDLVQRLVGALPGAIPTTPPTEATEATEATEPGDTPLPITPDILSGMFGDLFSKLEGLFKQLIELVASIPALIQTVIDTLVAGFNDVVTWFGTIGDTLSKGFADVITWFGTVADAISLGFANAKTWIEAQTAALLATLTVMGDAISTFFTVTFPAWITDVKAWALALPQTLIDALLAALAAAFVPAAGYWDAKIVACRAAFPLFDSIISTGKGLGGFFSGLGTRPPVIYIDLGSSTSWAIGGRTIFLDLTWYSKYKPTMDNVISAFLWLLFAWRLFLKVPGLLRGEGGTIDRLNTYLEHRDK